MRIRNRLLISFFIITALILVVVLYVGSTLVSNLVLKNATNKLESIAVIQTERTEAAINSYLVEANLVASRTDLRQNMVNLVNGGSRGQLGTAINSIIKDARNSVAIIKTINVYDPRDGSLVSTTGDLSAGELDYRLEDLANLRTSIVDLFTDDNNILTVRLLAPLWQNDRVVGVVEVYAAADRIVSITDDYTGLGESGEALLVATDSTRNVRYLNPLRFDSTATLKTTQLGDPENVPLLLAVERKDVAIFGQGITDYRDTEVLAVSNYIPATDWVLLAKIDRAEVLGPLKTIAQWTIVIGLAAILLATLIWTVVASSISNAVQELTSVALRFADGELSLRANSARNDEIGTLGQTFNQMAAKLADAYQNLEAKVTDKTKELKSNLRKFKQQNQQLEDTKAAMFNILDDVEAEKEKVAALATDLEKFKLAVDSASDQVVITDVSGSIIYANKSFEQTTGYRLKDVLGKEAGSKTNWGGQMPREFYEEMWDTIKNKKQSFHGELKNRRKNGEEYFASVTISPVLDHKGEIRFFVSIQRDISEEKAVDQAKTEFVSLSSHQLRTPLAAINWYAEMLKDGDAGKLNLEQLDYIGSIYESNQRMIELINSMLNVSRIELGTFAVDPKPLDFVKIAQSVVQEEQPNLTNRQIKLTTKFAKSIPKINADPKLVRIIMQNLLSNSIKYTKDDGKGKVWFSLSKKAKDKAVLIKVKDNGYGIPKDQHSQIFSKLFRADNVQALDTEGTGLGLYIVKSIVETAGGEIWFESTENRGTTFYVQLPLSGMIERKGNKELSG